MPTLMIAFSESVAQSKVDLQAGHVRAGDLGLRNKGMIMSLYVLLDSTADELRGQALEILRSYRGQTSP